MIARLAFAAVLLTAFALLAGHAIAPRGSAGDAAHGRCVVVDLDNRRHRHVLDHAWDATDRGQPVRLHVARDEAEQNRDESLDGIPTRPGYDRDEYPPAMSDEGGAGADVRYVRMRENRSAGAVMGDQLAGVREGGCFRFERRP